MNQHLIILFIVVPMAAGLVTMLLHRMRSLQQTIGLIALLANVGVGVWATATVFTPKTPAVLVSQMGNWPAPFGISIVVDGLAALMLVVSAFVCLCVFIYCISQLPDRYSGGYFHPLYHFLVMGVQWSFITGDLFNLFVAFEIMLMASYAMFVLGTTRAQMRQAYKYVLINLIGSTLFVTMAGLMYGQLGTLNFADITRIAMAGELPASSIPVIAMLLLVFGGKAAIFPLWYWLPDTYHTMPAAIGGLFAGLLTKVGAYVMIRIFVMAFGSAIWIDPDTGIVTYPVENALLPIVLISAAVTMFVGVLGAVSMHTVRSILSIHIISQVGYMVMGIGLGMSVGLTTGSRELGVAGAIFFIVHNMVIKCCLFLCGGLMHDHAGSDDLDRIGGLLRRAPWLAALFMIAAMSLAGLPPTSGFFGKFALIKAGWDAGGTAGSAYYWVTAFAITTSLLTLLSMLKIWSYGFWSPARGDHVSHPHHTPRTRGGILAIAMLVVMASGMGLGAHWCMTLARSAAANVIDPSAYVVAVLGEKHLPAAQHEAQQQAHTHSPLTAIAP
jgi:multicomponent Na+:H+ antiporter subunit D